MVADGYRGPSQPGPRVQPGFTVLSAVLPQARHATFTPLKHTWILVAGLRDLVLPFESFHLLFLLLILLSNFATSHKGVFFFFELISKIFCLVMSH